jgi:hypothetical protein
MTVRLYWWIGSIEALVKCLDYRKDSSINDALIKWLEQEEQVHLPPISVLTCLMSSVVEPSDPESILANSSENTEIIWGYLYMLCRSGKYNEAIQVCRDTKHFWKLVLLLSSTINMDISKLSVKDDCNMLTILGWISKKRTWMKYSSWKDELYGEIHCNRSVRIDEWISKNLDYSKSSALSIEAIHMYICWMIILSFLPNHDIITLIQQDLLHPSMLKILDENHSELFFYTLDMLELCINESKPFSDLFVKSVTFFISEALNRRYNCTISKLDHWVRWISHISILGSSRDTINRWCVELIHEIWDELSAFFIPQSPLSEPTILETFSVQWADLVKKVGSVQCSIELVLLNWFESILSQDNISTHSEYIVLALLLYDTIQSTFIDPIQRLKIFLSVIERISYNLSIDSNPCIVSYFQTHIFTRIEIKSLLFIASSKSKESVELLKLWQDYTRLFDVLFLCNAKESDRLVSSKPSTIGRKMAIDAINQVLHDQAWLSSSTQLYFYSKEPGKDARKSIKDHYLSWMSEWILE